MSHGWQRVGFVVAGDEAEALCDALAARGAVATEVSDAHEGTEQGQPLFGEPGAAAGMWERSRVRALFPGGSDIAAATRAALEASGVGEVFAASIDRLEDADWGTLTQRQFAPIRAGRGLWIVPSWRAAPPLASHTQAAGTLPLSGLLEAQAQDVIAAYRPWADLGVAARDEGWVLLAGMRH